MKLYESNGGGLGEEIVIISYKEFSDRLASQGVAGAREMKGELWYRELIKAVKAGECTFEGYLSLRCWSGDARPSHLWAIQEAKRISAETPSF